MDLEKALQELDLLQKRLYAYYYAQASINVDGETVAPSGSAKGRGVALGILAGEEQKLMTGQSTGRLLDFLSEHLDELDLVRRRQVEELKRNYDYVSKVPAEEYMEYAMLVNEASDIWHKAKLKDDFPMFLPALEKVIDYTRRFAGYYDDSKDPYDVLLDKYERGTSQAYLDQFFADIRSKLVPLIRAIGSRPQIDDSFVHRYYPIPIQRQFSDDLMQIMGLDRAHCTIGETEHPFTQELWNGDVRITTNYTDHNLIDSMYSVIHEGGHATYELGVRDDLQFTVLSGGVSMGVHESQSRFYENIIGRSEPFITSIFPVMREHFPDQLEGVSAHDMFLAVNKVQPSLVRVEADEVTYPLHIMIRYEIEKRLISGELAVKDIPGVWKEMYMEYLGVEVPDDKSGCLQDSHWSTGLIGYFPSYALGSAYGAQMLQNMQKEFDVWESVSRGDLSHVTAWLRERIHQYGSLYTPQQIVEKACGSFDPTCYTDYLTEKYSRIYGL